MTTELIPVAGGSHIWAEKAGDGPPLVLLHGSVHDSRLWNRVFAVLARHHTVRVFIWATDRVTLVVCATHEAPVPLGEVFEV
ncbi:hypothetical protein ABZY06_35940, partial [Streptomyces sp. NPDC006540]